MIDETMAPSEDTTDEVGDEISSFLQNLTPDELKKVITMAGEMLASQEQPEAEGISMDDYDKEMM